MGSFKTDTQHRRSWSADSHPSGQDIPHILWNIKFK